MLLCVCHVPFWSSQPPSEVKLSISTLQMRLRAVSSVPQITQLQVHLAKGELMLHRRIYHLVCSQPWLPTGIAGELGAPANAESPRVGRRHWTLSRSQVVPVSSRVKNHGLGKDPQTYWGLSGKNTRSIAP